MTDNGFYGIYALRLTRAPVAILAPRPIPV
jgi:hypothetical protein